MEMVGVTKLNSLLIMTTVSERWVDPELGVGIMV
jgi:hypothetical protein